MKPLVAFLNPPWFTLDPQTSELRRGIRAGSRWPFTELSNYTPDTFRVGSYLPAPQFLMSAAAWVRRACPEVDVVLRDSIARGESYNRFDAWWQETAPDYVIIETGAAAAEHDLRIVRAMKRSNPNCKVAIAGPNARELAAKADPAVDAWLLGEFERTAARFVNGERGILGFDLLTKADLETAPYPLYDEEVAHHYADACPKGSTWPEMQLWASRGCVYRCCFCSWPASMTNDDSDGKGKRMFRHYHPAWVEGFIRHRISVHAKTRFPLQSLRLDDDTFNCGNRHTRAISDVLRRIGLPWSAMCRADTVDRDTWRHMRDAGCFGVKLGFESASQRIVDEVIGKKLDLKEAEATCRFLRDIGMEVHSTWSVGGPSETPAERKLTIDTIRRFYRENLHTSHQLSGMATIEGTPLAHATITDPNFVRSPDGALKADQIMKAS